MPKQSPKAANPKAAEPSENQPEVKPLHQRSESGELSPSDSIQMLIELLKPAGPELGRRWLAALLLVPEAQRASVVEAVEQQICEEFGQDGFDGNPNASNEQA